MKKSKNLKPLYNFFVNQNGEILDLDDLLSYDTNANYLLKGRAELFGNKINFIFQGFSNENPSLSLEQLELFKRSSPSILAKLKNKYPNLSQGEIDQAHFVTETGQSIK
jgi:hypothetical protein